MCTPRVEWSTQGHALHGDAVRLDHAQGHQLGVFFGSVGCKAVVDARDDLLAAGKLELGAAKCLADSSPVLIFHTDRHEDLSKSDTRGDTHRLAVGATHSSLESIGSGAREHLVDSDDVEGMTPDAHVEAILAAHLHEVLVGANTSCFEGFARQLLVFL